MRKVYNWTAGCKQYFYFLIAFIFYLFQFSYYIAQTLYWYLERISWNLSISNNIYIMTNWYGMYIYLLHTHKTSLCKYPGNIFTYVILRLNHQRDLFSDFQWIWVYSHLDDVVYRYFTCVILLNCISNNEWFQIYIEW